MENTSITGKRILLREVQLSDVNANYHRWMNDPDVLKFTESRFDSVSRLTLEEYVRQKQADRDIVFMAIIFKENQQHIGNIKLGPINWTHRFGDVGIIIGAKEYWGQGCAAEAIQLLSDYAFNNLKLHKLTAGCYISNVAAGRAFEKAGFARECILKAHVSYEGKYQDVAQYALINSGNYCEI